MNSYLAHMRGTYVCFVICCAVYHAHTEDDDIPLEGHRSLSSCLLLTIVRRFRGKSAISLDTLTQLFRKKTGMIFLSLYRNCVVTVTGNCRLQIYVVPLKSCVHSIPRRKSIWIAFRSYTGWDDGGQERRTRQVLQPGQRGVL